MSRFFGSLCTNKNFEGAKEVAIAIKFIQKAKECTDFSSVRDIVTIFTYMIGVLRLQNSNLLSEFFGLATKFRQNKPKTNTNYSSV